MRVVYSISFNSRSAPRSHHSWAPEWDAWEKSILNTAASTLGEVSDNGDTIRLPPGTKAFGIMIQKGSQWIFAPGPDFPVDATVSQVFGRVGVNGGPIANQATEPVGKLGAAAISIPVSQLMGQARTIDKVESGKPKTCAALFPNEWPAQIPSLFAPGTPVTSWAKAMLNPPKFAGTTEEFATAFRGFLQQAAQAAGFDPSAYGKEIAFVIESVQSCAEITPRMAAQATTRGHFGSGQVVTRTLGEKYAVCQSGGTSGWNAQYPDTQIVVQVNSANGNNWQQGTGFTAFVYFVRAKQGAYPIVSANIRATAQ